MVGCTRVRAAALMLQLKRRIKCSYQRCPPATSWPMADVPEPKSDPNRDPSCSGVGLRTLTPGNSDGQRPAFRKPSAHTRTQLVAQTVSAWLAQGWPCRCSDLRIKAA